MKLSTLAGLRFGLAGFAFALSAEAAVFAQSSAAPMPLWAQLVATLGFPIVASAALAWHHVKTVRSKDDEIARLNEARHRAHEVALERVERIATTHAESVARMERRR